MKVIDRAKEHFASFGTQSMEVDEWTDEHGKPTKIYWTPLTLGERHKMIPDAFIAFKDISLMATVVVTKALDKSGNKLFLPEDILGLKHKVDPEVIGKIANQICATPTIQEQKKKS